MMQAVALIALLLLACASPLLTWLHLWQVKEWRWDRISEHFRQEGYGRLYGRVRLVMLALWLVHGFVIPTDVQVAVHDAMYGWTGLSGMQQIAAYLLLPLAALSLVQCLLRRQPMPVWTMKARLLCVLSVGMTLASGGGLLWMEGTLWNTTLLLAILPYLQPQISAVTWMLTHPLDRFLKRRIMAQARAIRSAHPNLVVIGITGSVGKTTTKELIAHVLADRQPLVPPEHVNTEMGVSQWLIQKLGKPETGNLKPETLIIEMGAYRIGEIALLCSIVQPTIGTITRIAEQHLALFGSLQAVCQAKGELFESLPEDGRAFVNADDPMCPELIKRCSCPITRVATDANADVSALDIEETPRGVRFTVQGTVFDLSLAGTHNVTNVLIAIGIGLHLGVPLPELARRLKSFAPPKRTFQVRQEHGITILDDTYNSSPASFAAAVEWAKQQPHARKILVTSGIIELGEAEERLHREIAINAQSVFKQAYVLSGKFLPYFQDGGFGHRASLLPSSPSRLSPGELLVCVGRMPPSVIDRLLPSSVSSLASVPS